MFALERRRMSNSKVPASLSNESQSLDLLRLLDALGRWNSHWDAPEEKEPEPEATAAFRVDAQTAGYIARQLELYPPFVYECLANVPVKEAKAIRDWLVSKQDNEPDFDTLKALYRWAKRHGEEYGLQPDEESYAEAREELNERMRSLAG